MLPGKKLTAADFWQMARRRVWLVVIPPAISIFAALVYSSRVPDLYQSDMLIAIDPQRVPEGFVRPTVTLRTDQRMDAISVQVLSRTNLERMIEEHNLYPKERQLFPMEDVVNKMRDMIRVDLERPRTGDGRDTPNAFHVMFTYTDPNVAAIVTQQLGSLYVQQNAKDREALALATNTFLETQLVEARQRLEAQEHKLEKFRQEHGKELPTQMAANLQALQTMQLQVQAVVEQIARDRNQKMLLDRMYRDAANEPIAAAPATIAPASTGPGADPAPGASAQQQLAAARSLLASLSLRYRPDHPDIVRTTRLIASLEPKAAAEAARNANDDGTASAVVTPQETQRRDRLNQMKAEIESLERQIDFKVSEESRLRGEIAEYQRRVEAVPGVESDWVSITRDYETQQLAYKDLLSKAGAAKVAVDLEQQQIGEHFRIVDPAGVPVNPLPSKRGMINAIGLAIGLVFGLGLAALLELMDASYRSDTDVIEILALPVLATVPFVETAAEVSKRRRRTMLLSATGVVCLMAAGYVTWTLQLWNSIK